VLAPAEMADMFDCAKVGGEGSLTTACCTVSSVRCRGGLEAPASVGAPTSQVLLFCLHLASSSRPPAARKASAPSGICVSGETRAWSHSCGPKEVGARRR
jgi:hypothetical protein